MLIALQLGIFVATTLYLEEYRAYIYSFLKILSVVVLIYIINSEGNPAFKMTWMLFVLAFPVVSTIFYLYVQMQPETKYMRHRQAEIKIETAPYMQQDPDVVDAIWASKSANANLSYYLSNRLGYPTYRNTEVKYFPLGEYKFRSMIAELKKAEKFIFLEYFIVEEGKMWGKMLEILLEKAKQGVEVRMLYDDMGSVALLPFGYSRKLEAMDPHIKCIPFNSVVPFLAMVMNNRDHRKILVVDGHTGFTGGINLADEYINVREKYGHWKDTGLKLVGDGVWNLTVMFMEMWNACSEAKLSPELYKADGHSYDMQQACEGFVQPFGDDPLDNENVGEDVYIEILSQAKKYVYIMTPYLILSDEMKRALVMAAKRGVDVRIITPGIPDKKIVFRLTRANYLPLLEAGVKIYEYTPGFVHAKSFLCDDTVGVVGTINLDYRSLFLHFENAVWMYKVPALADLKKDTIGTIERSRMVYKEDVHTKGVGIVLDGMLRVMAPLL